jgi:hypothetical protein
MNRNTDDVPGVKRFVTAYDKTPDEDGENYFVTRYELEPVSLKQRRVLYKVLTLE